MEFMIELKIDGHENFSQIVEKPKKLRD